LIEVGQHNLPTEMLLSDGHGCLASDRQTDDADSPGAKLLLLRLRDLVPVSVRNHVKIIVAIKQVDDLGFPGQIDPIAT
jgi:hypothetical protein